MTPNVFAGVTNQPACSNIAEAGKTRRRQFGIIGVVTAVGILVALMVLHVPWYWRLLLALPAMGASISLLQARRSVCIAHAATGSIEANDFSTTKATAEQQAQIRQVAKSIWVDSFGVGVAAGLVGALTAFIS